MRLTQLLFSLLLVSTQVHAQGVVDQWLKLKQDFQSKPYFFNDAINDQRTGVMSAFIEPLFGKEYATNNARPLTPTQLRNLPDGRFMDFRPFALAMAGRARLLKAGKIKNNPIMAIVDFSKHSRIRRFYIFNVHTGEVLMNTWVSHAHNSDKDKDGLPETFSNISGSEMSSVGFMTTGETYNGAYGFSQRLNGLDPVLNSKVLSRAVVIHGFGGLGAHEASWGKISTSMGCLMVSTNESGLFWGLEDESLLRIVIETLRTGALIFTYTDIEDADGNPLIFKSTWIKPSDVPEEVPVNVDDEEEATDTETETVTEPEVEENHDEEVVDHHPHSRSRILNAVQKNQ